jgi:hypothetical protein
MTPEIQQAIKEIQTSFPENRIEVIPETQGGAYVIVHDLLIGEQYISPTNWVGFLMTFQYPNSDVYPHFTDINLHRRDNNVLGQGLSKTTWQNKPAIQVSRRSKRWNPAVDNAAIKLAKVLNWLKTQ